MSEFDSIVNVEEWISEHYFTADKGATFASAQADLVKTWKADKADGYSTPITRFSSQRADLQAKLATLDEAGEDAILDVSAQLRGVLGFGQQPEILTFERGSTDYEITGVVLGGDREVLWLTATPAESIDDVFTSSYLIGVHRVDGKDRLEPIGKVLSELYLSSPSPQFIVVSAGSYLFLTDRERWPEGRYLGADVQLVAERNDAKDKGEINRFLSIFSRNSLVPDSDGTIWWNVRLEESREHAVGVSKDLRDGIRESIEIIANDVLVRRTARGLSNDDLDGQELARQSLRYLYRILFLLYAEASPELGVLPKGAGEYDAGYGLDRLRELIQVELSSYHSRSGTHIYESLALLFQLVNGDHPSQRRSGTESDETEGLTFEPLKADLFQPEATSLIDDVGLSNAELQRVLERLLLSKRSSNDRGFISYANLGINQLGAVYEGLMSYTGFIAKEDLREVAKDGDASAGSWVVPVHQADDIENRHLVTRLDDVTNTRKPVLHKKGSFVFRLAGRERQQSASFYSPEVITRFVVSQALEELLTEDTAADDILKLTVCEPALGSGAFALEAVRQLAAEYLERKQKELGEEISAEDYPLELQRVKAHIALHQIYGVDLNATAVELAEVSLWLDTMLPGLHAPWFGLHLRRGNSLIGAKRAVYSPQQVAKKLYLTEAPRDVPLSGLANAALDGADNAIADGIHHFLLPSEGWGAAADAKELRGIADDEVKRLKEWVRSIRVKLSKAQVKELKGLAKRVETLWRFVLYRLSIAESEARRFIDYWPHRREFTQNRITREQIESSLRDPNGAYMRLRRVMDAWCALWFWPLQTEINPPSLEKWIEALKDILGTHVDATQPTFSSALTWDDLGEAETLDLELAGSADTTRLSDAYPWLRVCDSVAKRQGFFHWELDFASVFSNGGFDLQVGNPPWVRPRSDMDALFAETDVWFQLAHRPTQAAKRTRQQRALEQPGARESIIEAAPEIPVTAAFLGSPSQYPLLRGLQPDLYRSFMSKTWQNMAAIGVVGLVHPESHLTEKKAGALRRETYSRLRRHWQFLNELMLYEISNHVVYGIHIYGPRLERASFITASSLYHPETVTRSLKHDGSGEIPGLKDSNNEWDRRPHAERLIRVDNDVLEAWASISDKPGTPAEEATMLYPVNRASTEVLNKLAHAPRVRNLHLQFSRGWDEAMDRKRGYFEVGSKVNVSWDDVILQGPFFSIANPFFQEANPSMRSNRDYTELDLEVLPSNFIPRTSYQPNRDGDVDYDSNYGTWTLPDGSKKPVRDFYRLAWRNMAAVTGVRTFYPTVIPPGAAHVHAVYSAGGFANATELLGQLGIGASLPTDFMVKAGGASKISFDLLELMPRFNVGSPASSIIVGHASRLVCVSSVFAELWEEAMGTPWTSASPERNARERRQLLVELDALAALELGITADELCTIYRTQFSVLHHRYEKVDRYDANGRKVPREIVKLWEKVGDEGLTRDDRTWTHPQSGVTYTFELPFVLLDREEDMRAAYAKFEPLLHKDPE
ncbi:hypothetical protein SAMN02910418_01572 [Bowdeniella nasicola]|uniref:site-specific DNA-methyltransferase (adenine-specific) n=1 Tax=Bowdeniella nasicola TaxID=208480 RepID=A0A1H4B578_9ACTO|nr:DNA methyltransferase [Bowdeniella nasicola]SEA43291.1 hypothetical protein SAMN02910418_01572 [Bowdeniella nasicola]